MPLRNILLRVMLWSLALAAVTGVVAVLSQGGELAWRVIGTGFATALACGLMLLASRLIDREKSRLAGLLGMAGVIAEYVMAILLIWDIPRYLLGGWWEEKIAATTWFLGVAVLVAMALLRALNAPIAAVGARVGIIATFATFVAVEIAIWWPGRSRDPPEVWATAGVIALFGTLAAVTLVGLGTGDRRHWRSVGIAPGAVAALMWLIHIWMGTGSDLGEVIFSVLLSVTVVVAHANLCLLRPLPPQHSWVPCTAMGAAMLSAGLIVLLVIDDKLFPVGIGKEVLGRLAAAGAIVAGCATLAVMVLVRMNRKVDFEMLSVELPEITVVCPRCSKKQAIPVGGAICSGCELRISITIEEPRCPKCDYLLYGLLSDRCPECGTLIAALRAKSPVEPDACAR